MTTDFIISKAEITRRKKAFITLACSLTIGLVLTSTKFMIANPWPATITLSLVTLFLALSSILLFKFLNSVSKTRISLHDEYLQRDNGNKIEELLLNDIKSISIKRTSQKTLRRITLVFNNQPPIVLNGLEHFEQFRKTLLSKIGKNVVLKESYEPIDFDHPLFYVFLGFLISYTSVTSLKLLIAYRILENPLAFALLSCFPVAVGLYFIFQKPLAKEYGTQRQLTDYMWGFSLICAGIALYLLGR